MSHLVGEYDCTICYDTLTYPMNLPCHHVLCRNCVYQLHFHNCPVCRRSFNIQTLQVNNELMSRICQYIDPHEYNEMCTRAEERFLQIISANENPIRLNPQHYARYRAPQPPSPISEWPRYPSSNESNSQLTQIRNDVITVSKRLFILLRNWQFCMCLLGSLCMWFNLVTFSRTHFWTGTFILFMEILFTNVLYGFSMSRKMIVMLSLDAVLWQIQVWCIPENILPTTATWLLYALSVTYTRNSRQT